METKRIAMTLRGRGRRACRGLLRIVMLMILVAGLCPVTDVMGGTEAESKFTLEDGFTITEAAGPALVERPITGAFDERGRLYVAESSGSNDPVGKQLEERPHRILRLEDRDGDGVFDHRTVFADRMMFPAGTMWRDGSLYVAAPPQIWKLTDRDDDGVADDREVWFDGRTLTGCANDLHGPYAGPDGWIYWCKGAFAEQTYPQLEGEPLVTRAAHIFRWRPDRRGPIEPVMTGGMDNPVDVVFTPGGERIFTTTFLQHPAGGRRDGLIHALYGGVYGKVHGVLDGHPRTRPEVLAPLTHLGPAAPSGLLRYRGEALGASYRDNLFACQFNLRTVSRHVLIPDGASYRTEDSAFLVSSDNDFHPTDVIEDADGSLLVIDTGGWYKLCCPTSQLHKPDVLGAIYRVAKADAPAITDPRGLSLDWDGVEAEPLADRLGDPRVAVRQRTVDALGRLGERAVSALLAVVEGSSSSMTRRQAVWAASRIDGDPARAVVRHGLLDVDATVRQAALHASAVRRDAGALAMLLDVLRDDGPVNQRVAAEALGRIGDVSAVPALLDATSAATDPGLIHSLTYALIEIGDVERIRLGLKRPDIRTQRAAMIALDQIDPRSLRDSEVIPLLSSDDADARAVAVWIAGRHPEWASSLESELRRRITALGSDRSGVGGADPVVELLTGLASAPPIQRLLVEIATEQRAGQVRRRLVLTVMEAVRPDPAPEDWLVAVADLIDEADPALLDASIRVAKALQESASGPEAERLTASLLRCAHDEALSTPLRLNALGAISASDRKLDGPTFDWLLEVVTSDEAGSDALQAADLLSSSTLTREQKQSLADAMQFASPLASPRLLGAFEGVEDSGVAIRLVRALADSRALATIRPGDLRRVLAPHNAVLGEQAVSLLASLDAGADRTRARIDRLLALINEGDVGRGQAVFNGTRAACRTCHAMGYVGGKLGPDLTRIGRVRTERDLLEAILAPSASFVRSYEPMLIATVDGRVLNGILVEESDDVITVQIGADLVERLPRSDVEEMRPGTVSVMPAGLDEVLDEQELLDLVRFLKASR